MRFGKYDGIILGAAFGLVVSTPKLAMWISDLINSLVPANYYIFGSLSLSVFGLIAGGLIGFIVEKTGK